MNQLTRAQILATDDLKKERVDVPEWGGFVYVTVLPGTEKDAFEASMVVDGKASLDNARAKLAMRCMVDEAGARLFADEDVDALGAKSGVALERVSTVAQRLNRMTDKDIEDLKGN